jgi:hypothetical protein
MQEIGIDLTEAELQEPHRYKDKIRKVFLCLVRSSDLAVICAALLLISFFLNTLICLSFSLILLVLAVILPMTIVGILYRKDGR